jgi:hypothetical protein
MEVCHRHFPAHDACGLVPGRLFAFPKTVTS